MRITIPIPKEHGLYVVLAASWLLGLIYAPTFRPVEALAILGAALSGIFLQEPLRRLIVGFRTGRNRSLRSTYIGWSVLFGTLFTASLLPLYSTNAPLWRLVPPAAAIMGLTQLLVYRRASATTLSAAGFPGAALAAPAVVMVSGGPALPADLIALWLLASLFFCGSIYCVRIRLTKSGGVGSAALYYAAAVTLVGLLTVNGLLSAVAPIAMLLGALRLLWIVLRLEQYRALPLKSIGVQESAAAILFLLLNAVYA